MTKKEDGYTYLYGPVPSRRLGRSLGIDMVPYKVCSYDCIYCQLGRTTDLTLRRRRYVPAEKIVEELKRKLAAGARPDYISLAGSGEPTLNSDLGVLIREIKQLTDIPVAVLTNGSLLWMPDVQDELMQADLVVPSLDAGSSALFRYVNRPQKELSFEQMVDGLVTFAQRFEGEIHLEVLLLAGVTGIESEVMKIAELSGRIGATRVQLNSVDRPPVENFAFPVAKAQLEKFAKLFPGNCEIISDPLPQVVQPLGLSPVREAEVLALLSRRPCTSQDVAAGLGIHNMEALKLLSDLYKVGKLTTSMRDDHLFYSAVEHEQQYEVLSGQSACRV
ncbi:Wyosine [tRNA(Phe)-imidazoG37] synthetase, radical SAM superfamily [Malonomonas rubra DSM 5091]|uniref:Wyosine [tRNA(Phe)-imidazoG37] synthetase, radical SAM superfamily n=1 Tax=Malonomonas rubra DSM 5091 TaxID=1122189 RepID=A0A1M6EVB9_MALRU|nr:radical SAM protein [Malonomonas rubra]SHI89320.1 Wyosine [tRNA(Phe)-imidazoG37] synthetase, radical SAM superfamily [Malonomonas rubra DSM 5091]